MGPNYLLERKNEEKSLEKEKEKQEILENVKNLNLRVTQKKWDLLKLCSQILEENKEAWEEKTKK